jgi:uridylate kinase
MKYKRVLLKLSGEALSAGSGKLYDDAFLARIAGVLRRCLDEGAEIGVIVGAGNIWRGRQGGEMDSVRADTMGMLATAINAIALQDAFCRAGIDTRVMTAMEMQPYAEVYSRDRADYHLSRGRVVIFGCGIGLPFFSTDTAGALRAAEIGADVMLMAKNIDGIYTADPQKDPGAVRLDHISCGDILSHGLKAIDATATAFCMEHDIPILVFGLDDPDNIYRAIAGDPIGTIVDPSLD